MHTTMKCLLIFALLLAPAAQAGPRHWAKGLGHQFKQTFYTDVKAHPVQWLIPMALQLGAGFADTATSCMRVGNIIEGQPARTFIGRYPSCPQYVGLSIGTAAVGLMSENYFAHKFQDSCDRQAADKNSMWWKVDAHSHDPKGCMGALSYMFAVPYVGVAAVAVHNNIDWLK